MNRNLLNTLIMAALVAPSAAMAADAPSYTLTPNVGVVSDYLVRGISQTKAKPALQAGLDFAHTNGLYLGIWGSNVTWITDFGAVGTANLEIDTYGGFKNAFATDYSYDVGYIRYNYPGKYTPNEAAGLTKGDTQEVYGALGYKWLTAKYSYSLGDFLTVPNAKGTSYIDLTASYTIESNGVSLAAHWGKQTYKGADADAFALAGFDPTYTDYKLSVSKDFSGYVTGLAYSSTSAPKDGFYTTTAQTGSVNLAKSTVVLSVLHSF